MLSYCALSDHWHFVVWPETDGQVTNAKARTGPATGGIVPAPATILGRRW
jgi:hypothetical protein